MGQPRETLRRTVRPVVFLAGLQMLIAVAGALSGPSEQFDGARFARELSWRLPIALFAGALYGILRPRFSSGRGGAALCGSAAGAATGVLWGIVNALAGAPVFEAFVLPMLPFILIGAVFSQFERPPLKLGVGIRTD